MLTLTFALLFKLLLPLLVVAALLDLLTRTTPQRVQLLHCQGLSERRIAARLGITRYAVRCAL